MIASTLRQISPSTCSSSSSLSSESNNIFAQVLSTWSERDIKDDNNKEKSQQQRRPKSLSELARSCTQQKSDLNTHTSIRVDMGTSNVVDCINSIAISEPPFRRRANGQKIYQWDEKQDSLLVDMVRNGVQWEIIRKTGHFGQRTVDALQRRYSTLIKTPVRSWSCSETGSNGNTQRRISHTSKTPTVIPSKRKRQNINLDNQDPDYEHKEYRSINQNNQNNEDDDIKYLLKKAIDAQKHAILDLVEIEIIRQRKKVSRNGLERTLNSLL